MKLASAFLALSISLTSLAAPVTENIDYTPLYAGLEFDMPVISRPTFPDRTVSLDSAGGVPDGRTVNTEAINTAIENLSAQGGGTLIVPSGIWLTGPIRFRSNINLYLEQGALILFSADQSLYPLVSVAYEGFNGYRCTSPIYGENLENVAITGKGVIDGNGNAWRYVNRGKMNSSQWSRLKRSGGMVVEDTWYPSEQYYAGMKQRKGLGNQSAMTLEEASAIKDFLRPNMVKFVNCKNVCFDGVLFQNSPAWTLHPIMCENVIIDNVYLKNPVYAQNSDGMDVESCRNVIICRTTLDVGDDAVCIKSGKDEAGRRRGIPTENVIVRECRVFEGHGGFVVGSEMSGGVKNISVADCEFIGTDVGLRFKSNRGRGGVVENIYIRDVNMANISQEALLFDLYYAANGGPKHENAIVSVETPQFKKIHIDNVKSYNSCIPVKFNGLPEMPIEGITVTNSIFTSVNGGLVSESKDIIFNNVDISASKGAALTVNNTQNFLIKGCTFTSPDSTPINYTGTNPRLKVVR